MYESEHSVPLRGSTEIGNFFFLFTNLLSFLNIRCSHLILRITNLSYTTSDKINFVIEF